MTDDIDHLDGDDSDLREQVMRRLRGEGLRIAVEAAITVAGDSKAPAPARATAAGLIMRGAGVLDRGAQEADDKPLHEMSAAELARAVRRADAEVERSRRKLRQTAEADIFS